jgi:hypothetical protein
MKDRIIKSLKGLSITAVLMLTFYVCYRLWWCYNAFVVAEWDKAQALRITMLVVLILTSLALLGLTILFFTNLWKGLKQGNIFPRNNFSVLCWEAGVAMFHFLCADNLALIFSAENELSINLKVFFIPVFLLVCAMLYRLANIAAEENNLTI